MLNDPLLSSFPLFDSPPPSSHNSSIPSSPSSISTTDSTSSKRSRKNKNSSPFNFNHSSDDDFDICEPRRRKTRNKSENIEPKSALSLRDPMMMSTSHSPTHFSSDLCSYMDQMFFSSSQYLSPSLAADDTIDLCSILKTENSLSYDRDTIMIGWWGKFKCHKKIWSATIHSENLLNCQSNCFRTKKFENLQGKLWRCLWLL